MRSINKFKFQMSKKNQKKVLVIDDEKVLRELLLSKIGQAGFEVVGAADGDEGLKKALAEHPDLILLDIIMPKMDGITMLKKLREDVWGKIVPVIVLSNLNTAEAVEKSLESGAYDYLVKVDYSLDDLVGVVRKKLGA